MTTIWEAAEAAYAAERKGRIDAARARLQAIVGDSVELPPHDLHQDTGVIIHDGDRGLLVGDTGHGAVRFVVREEGNRITPVGGELHSLADLGRILATHAAATTSGGTQSGKSSPTKR